MNEATNYVKKKIYSWGNMTSRLFSLFLLLASFTIPAVHAEEILVRTPAGHTLTVEVTPEASFADVMRDLKQQMLEVDSTVIPEGTLVMDFMGGYTLSTARRISQPRDYYRMMTPNEVEDLSYIVKTLATSSWARLLKDKSSIKKAGDRVDHIHPLRSLLTIFSSTELRGAIFTVRDRSKIWKEFYSGLSDRLNQEAAIGNVTMEQIQDFSARLGISPDLIAPALQGQRWDDFASILFDNLPRGGNTGRYDI